MPKPGELATLSIEEAAQLLDTANLGMNTCLTVIYKSNLQSGAKPTAIAIAKLFLEDYISQKPFGAEVLAQAEKVIADLRRTGQLTTRLSGDKPKPMADA
jgi:hypothetical protein